jgi:hypothetical protein
MKVERLQLAGRDRTRYFIPTVICAYLATICIVLMATSLFLVSVQNAVAVTAAGAFGLLLSGGLGVAFWTAQRRDLEYLRLVTNADAAANFDKVKAALQQAGWRIVRAEPALRLDAITSGAILEIGERVAVEFRGNVVLVASICDPSVGFSLAGRRHCAAHRDLVRQGAPSA